MAKAAKGRGRPKGSRNKSKSQPAAAAEQAKLSPSSDAAQAFKKPSTNQVKALAKRMDSFATEAKESSDLKKEAISKAVETQHFNRAALSAAMAWRRRAKKDPVKFSTEFAHFLAYIDDLELDQIANESRGLDLDGDEDGDMEVVDETPRTSLRMVPGPEDDGFDEPQADEAA
jgi:DNA polymerase III delta subunit